MKIKSRDYRKLERARKRYSKILENTVGYSKQLLFADLHMKYVARWFFTKYPKKLPRLTFTYKS